MIFFSFRSQVLRFDIGRHDFIVFKKMKTQGLCSEIFHRRVHHTKVGTFSTCEDHKKNLNVDECKIHAIADMLCCTGYP